MLTSSIALYIVKLFSIPSQLFLNMWKGITFKLENYFSVTLQYNMKLRMVNKLLTRVDQNF